jgi:hypothetical protein
MKKNHNYKQLCVLHGVIVGENSKEEFIEWLKETFDVRGLYSEEVVTLPTPDVPDTGGRNDLFFYIHDDDIEKFAVPRLAYRIRWWEDVLNNGGGELYDEKILEKYPKTW